MSRRETWPEYWEDFTLADVRVENTSRSVQLRAHSLMLSKSSVVLKSELQSILKWDEKPWRIVMKINQSESENSSQLPSQDTTPTDIDEEIMRKFLYFVYHKEIKDWGSSCTTLLKLGHTYKMEDLMKLCDDHLLATLSSRNAVKCMILAKDYGRQALKEKVINHIQTNMGAVIVSKDWKKLEEDLKLLGEILVMSSHPGAEETLPTHIPHTAGEVTWYVDLDKRLTKHTSILTILIDRDVYVDIQVDLERSARMGPNARTLEIRSTVLTPSTKLQSYPLVFIITMKTKQKGVLSERILYIEDLPNETLCFEVIHDFIDVHPPNQFSLTVAMKGQNYVHCALAHPFLRLARAETRFTDVEILVGKDKYPVHRIVLAAHSTFFSELFGENLRLTQHTLNDNEISSDDFQTLKYYMYVGSLPNPTMIDLPLLRAAYYLKLSYIVMFCSYVLMDALSVENAVDICVASETMGLQELNFAAVKFIADKIEVIARTEKWMSLKDHPNLIKEVARKVTAWKPTSDFVVEAAM